MSLKPRYSYFVGNDGNALIMVFDNRTPMLENVAMVQMRYENKYHPLVEIVELMKLIN